MKRVALCIAVLLCLCGCGWGTSKEEIANETVLETQYSGGQSALNKNINLKELDISVDKQSTRFTMYFIKGSRTAGVDEAAVNKVPEYKVTMLKNPSRLKIEFKNIEFWDYTSPEVPQNSLIYGQFNQNPVGNSNFVLYIGLKEDVRCTIKEQDGRLILSFDKMSVPSQEKQYYVTINAYDDYIDGLITFPIELSPVLCNNLSDVLLISDPYPTEKLAGEQAKKINDSIEDKVPNLKAFVQALEHNQLPAMGKSVKEETLGKKSVLKNETGEVTLPVVMQNARYLCSAPDGSMLFARTIQPDLEQDVEPVNKESIWRVDAQGKKGQMDLKQFYNIKEVEYSPDGKYLAILDSDSEQSLLYLYDIKTQELKNLGEYGFGSYTASFDWNSEKNILYAMTGLQSIQLTEYDADSGKIKSIEEKQGSDCEICYANGKVYFVLYEKEKDYIYSVDVQTAKRTKVCEGSAVEDSPDGSYIAVLKRLPGEEESLHYDIDILDTKTGAMVSVVKNKYINQMAFAGTENRLYYTYAEEEYEDHFHWSLTYFDTKTDKNIKEGNICTEAIAGETNGRGLMIVDYVQDEDFGLQVTFEYIIKEK